MRTVPALLLLAALAAAPALDASSDPPQGGNGSPPPKRLSTDYLGSGLVPHPRPGGLPEGSTMPHGVARPLPIPSRMTTSSLRARPGEVPSTAQPTKALSNRGPPPTLPPKPEAGLVPPTRKAGGRGGPPPQLATSSTSPSSPSISSPAPVMTSSAAGKDGDTLPLKSRSSRHAMSLKPDEARQLQQSFSSLSPLGSTSSAPRSSSSSAPISSQSADERVARLEAELHDARLVIEALTKRLQEKADEMANELGGELLRSSSSSSSSGDLNNVDPSIPRKTVERYTGGAPFWTTQPTMGGESEETKYRVRVHPDTWRRAPCTQYNKMEQCGEFERTGLICHFHKKYSNTGMCVKLVGDNGDLCAGTFFGIKLDESYAMDCGKGMKCATLNRKFIGRLKGAVSPQLATCQVTNPKALAKELKEVIPVVL